MSHIARANLTLTTINVDLMTTVMNSVVTQRVALGAHMELLTTAEDSQTTWQVVTTPIPGEQVVHADYWQRHYGQKASMVMVFDGQTLRFEFDQDFQATAEAIQHLVQQTYVSAALQIALANSGFQLADSQAVEIDGERHLVMRGVAA